MSRIPKGETRTYKDIACVAGSPRAFRAVGTILRTYDANSIHIPCHRVVRSDGTLGEYRWGRTKKVELLKKEKAIS